MILEFIKIFTILLSILAIIHGVLYYSLLEFLQLRDYSKQVLSAIIFLSVSFPLSAFFNHFINNTFTRFFATLAGLWIAIALYSLLTFILLWVLKGGLHLGGVNVNSWVYIARVCMVIIVLFVGYGFIKAYTIKITEVPVALKNLPTAWEGKKIAHISDVHLGGVWGPGRVKTITQMLNDIEPELVVITGDLFDGSSGRHEKFLEALKGLAKVKSTHGVYFSSGNHERYANYKSILSVLKKSGIITLEDKIVNLNDLQLVGMKYPDLKNPHNMKNEIFDVTAQPGYSKEKPAVLLYHTPNEINDVEKGIADMQKGAYTNPNTEFKNARAAGIDLQLSGHTHAGQFFPFIRLTRKLFNGFHYGLHRVEDFQIYIHAGTGT